MKLLRASENFEYGKCHSIYSCLSEVENLTRIKNQQRIFKASQIDESERRGEERIK